MQFIQSIISYLKWADATIWEIVQNLSDDEFNHSFDERGGSIRKRYVHLAEDIWEWYHDWTGIVPENEIVFSKMSRKELFESISEYVEQLEEMIDDSTLQEFSFDTETSSVEMQLEEFVFHLTNHATYHRGQIVMCLRMLGKDVPVTDYVPFRINASD